MYAGTGASFTSTFFATVLACAMSAAMRVMRRISSSVMIGLLANPHDAAVDHADAEAGGAGAPRVRPGRRRDRRVRQTRRAPPPSPATALRSLLPLALTPLLTLRVKRMSAYEQPAFFASPSATSDSPLNGDCMRILRRRLRDQLADDVGGGDEQRGRAGVFQKVATRGMHGNSKVRRNQDTTSYRALLVARNHETSKS